MSPLQEIIVQLKALIQPPLSFNLGLRLLLKYAV